MVLKENLGAVIRARWATHDPALYVFTDRGWRLGESLYLLRELDVLEVLNPGYEPPTPEPQNWGAVVVDADNEMFSRSSKQLEPWTDKEGYATNWSYLTQPVKVLYEGVHND